MQILFILGIALYCFGTLWFAVLAFRESLLWGLGVLFLPFVGLIFAFNRWDITKRPLLTTVIGGALAFFSYISGTGSVGGA